MGSMFGWECATCGASECFSCDCATMSMRDADDVRRACEGDYGRAMATLFKDGVPGMWGAYGVRHLRKPGLTTGP